MADNIIALNDLDILFADFIQAQLNLSDKQVLISYSRRGQRSSKIDEDVCYIKVFNEQDERNIYKQRKEAFDPETEQVTITQFAMRTLRLQVVFYGPNSDVLSTKLNELFYLNRAKEFLYNNNLAFIPDRTNIPIKSYEKINEQFWERADLKLYFYNSTSVEEVVDIIDKLDVQIYGLEDKT